MVVVQKIKKSYSQMDLAIAYYSMISVLNKLNLTQRELQLLAFTAIRGSITNPAAREDFCQMYSTSQPTINNIISRLRKLKLFVKEQNKIKVNTAIALDFTSPIILQLTLNIEK
jgi:DNA-binding MarR family transcriptional regulator